MTTPTEQAKHTARKWEIRHEARFRSGGVGFTMRGPEAGNFNVELLLPSSAGVAKAAELQEFILTAVNAHQELVEALRAMVADSKCETLNVGERCARTKCTTCDARALLSKIGGGK